MITPGDSAFRRRLPGRAPGLGDDPKPPWSIGDRSRARRAGSSRASSTATCSTLDAVKRPISLDLAARVTNTVGLDLSPTASIGQGRGRTARADQRHLRRRGHSATHRIRGRFGTIVDSTLFHRSREAARATAFDRAAAARGASYFVLVFDRASMPAGGQRGDRRRAARGRVAVLDGREIQARPVARPSVKGLLALPFGDVREEPNGRQSVPAGC